MTAIELKIAKALQMVSFLPGSFDKKFVNKLPDRYHREMSPKGRSLMIEILHKYRGQIPIYTSICYQLYPELFVEEKTLYEPRIKCLVPKGKRIQPSDYSYDYNSQP
jgi:hypothetical protein